MTSLHKKKGIAALLFSKVKGKSLFLECLEVLAFALACREVLCL